MWSWCHDLPSVCLALLQPRRVLACALDFQANLVTQASTHLGARGIFAFQEDLRENWLPVSASDDLVSPVGDHALTHGTKLVGEVNRTEAITDRVVKSRSEFCPPTLVLRVSSGLHGGGKSRRMMGAQSLSPVNDPDGRSVESNCPFATSEQQQ